MFLKFRSRIGDREHTRIIECDNYHANHYGICQGLTSDEIPENERIDVTVTRPHPLGPMADGERESLFIISHYEHDWQICYVMNDAGKTVEVLRLSNDVPTMKRDGTPLQRVVEAQPA